MTEQLYRCDILTPVGLSAYVDVMAPTGDKAAEFALEQNRGGRVTAVNPAPASLQPHLQAKKAA